MKKYRPRCPINGVLLVIPADSLIRDTADQIEQKASKIARQFDMIQRTLDVRFPVFVVVTKSDLINGFRDFFDNLQDPQLQHQILGWSNPAPLDEPYNTDFVDLHLKAIRGRLFRRRLALLHEVMSEEPGDEKIRTADTLYAFPQSLAKIAPRMARYRNSSSVSEVSGLASHCFSGAFTSPPP
jgi:type VI protein secretion system component VasK